MSYHTIQPKGTSTAPIHIRSDVWERRAEITANRRWFHAHPELSFQEHATAAKIVTLLREYGITDITEGVGRTGVVALIKGEAGEGPCIALRADMDALPITETADVDYASVNTGVMHACGHDGHCASLLATAAILQKAQLRLRGSVKLVFQPAEEGYAGAREMLEAGVLESPHVESIYGIHLWSYVPLGVIGCDHGPLMAASDRFIINVGGKGGHGAAPHGTVDAIVEAASLVSALQTVCSRNLPPLESGVLTCGTIKGGYASNIIADSVEITGTCRSFKAEVQDQIENRMEQICCGVAATYGGQIDLKYKRGYPATVNSYPEEVELVQRVATQIVGEERAGRNCMTMAAEDFSFFLQERSGCFFFVGAALPGDVRPHHKSVFDFDEDALLVSVSMFLDIVYARLGV